MAQIKSPGDQAGERNALSARPVASRRRLVIVVCVILIVAVAWVLGIGYPELVGQMWSNLGLVMLNKALVAQRSECSSQAETLLRKALSYAPEGHRAWRGLGFALADQNRETEALVAWERAGGMTEEFLERAEWTLTWGLHDETLVWSERAAALMPDLRDAWYYMGRAYSLTNQWRKALEAYKRAAESDRSLEIGRSRAYYQMGVIYQWRLEQAQQALAAYDAALYWNDFSDSLEGADCHYKRVEILLWMGGDPGAHIAELRHVIEMNPNHVGAHVLLGVAYYARYLDVNIAEAEIRAALELNPRNASAYGRLGDIYRHSGRFSDAVAMYEQALEIDPGYERARQALQELRR